MTKVVIIDGDNKISSSVIGPTGPEHRHLAGEVMKEAMNRASLSFDKIAYLVATGYGRINVPFADRQITELSCHARGVAELFSNVRTAIDIGGQDAKGMKIKDGKLIDFVMNDKCAAGTGRFLEVLAETLGIKIEDLGNISDEAKETIEITSICTIFARQEVISYLSDGKSLPDIISGLHDAIAGRVVRMVARLNIEPDVVLTGGVAKNSGVVRAVNKQLGFSVLVPDDPLLSGALGAAILGKESFERAERENKPIKRKERLIGDATFFG